MAEKQQQERKTGIGKKSVKIGHETKDIDWDYDLGGPVIKVPPQEGVEGFKERATPATE